MSDVNTILKAIEKRQIRATSLPEFRVGDTLKVFVKIKEGDKERIQAFEGVCIKRTNNANRATFTVRKMSYGVGVERVFPTNSPNIDKVEITTRGRVRRARLFYLRDLKGKAARIRAAAAEQTVAVEPAKA